MHAHWFCREARENSSRESVNMATLFSYFTPKSKKPSSPVCGDTADKKKNNSPKEGAQGFSPINDKKSTSPNTPKASRTQKDLSGESGLVKIERWGLVWAKLEGHPWWPSLICDHPTQRVYERCTKWHRNLLTTLPLHLNLSSFTLRVWREETSWETEKKIYIMSLF